MKLIAITAKNLVEVIESWSFFAKLEATFILIVLTMILGAALVRFYELF